MKRNTKKYLIWAIILIIGMLTLGSCFSWGLSGLLEGKCVFDTSTFDSNCVMK